jgi:predicted Zn-dependent protease
LSYLESNRLQSRAIDFLEGQVNERSNMIELHQRLAEQYRLAGRIENAVTELDRIGDMFMDQGNQTATIAVIQTILSLNPPNAEEYSRVLEKLQSGEVG